MPETFMLTELTQVRAIAHPLRLRILEAFSQGPRTTKQVAVEMREHPTRLYHHVDMLARAGLLEFVGTKGKRGTTERYFRAAAPAFQVDRKVLECGAKSAQDSSTYAQLFLAGFQASLQEARESVAAGLIQPETKGRNALLYRRHLALGVSEQRQLTTRIREWLRQLRRRPGARFGVALAVYPLPGRAADTRRSNARRKGR